ncbi:MAG: hypothetical protein GF320_08670 [Armatimonadia bacterium]|nr:hypothetical protein [Armatimonadia bacterium]
MARGLSPLIAAAAAALVLAGATLAVSGNYVSAEFVRLSTVHKDHTEVFPMELGGYEFVQEQTGWLDSHYPSGDMEYAYANDDGQQILVASAAGNTHDYIFTDMDAQHYQQKGFEIVGRIPVTVGDPEQEGLRTAVSHHAHLDTDGHELYLGLFYDGQAWTDDAIAIKIQATLGEITGNAVPRSALTIRSRVQGTTDPSDEELRALAEDMARVAEDFMPVASEMRTMLAQKLADGGS